MAQYFRIHPHNPQPRLIRQAVDIIRQGGVVVYPTDATYSLGCALGEKQAVERITRIRRLENKHKFTILCRDLSELATYARVDNQAFRLLKANTPGPYTFILNGTTSVPRLLMHPKRKEIGLRVPDCPITQALLEELGEPLLNTTLQLPDDDYPMIDPEEMKEVLGKQVDLVIDGGFGDMTPTTVIRMTDNQVEIIREGKGDISPFA